MKRTKRFLALLMAVLMTVAVVPVAAFAEDDLRRYYQENFTRTMCIDKLEQELKNACRNGN